MISFNEGEYKIKGTNLQVMTDFNFIVDELLNTSPEIVLATFFARNEQLKEYINKCEPINLELATDVVKRIVIAMEEAKDEKGHN